MTTDVHRIGKLGLAIKLTSKPTCEAEYKNYNENLQKGMGLFNQLCLSNTIPPDDKLDIIVEYIKYVPDSGLDMLVRWRDMTPFLTGRQLEDLISLLTKITRSPNISSHERVITAVSLYNNCFLHVCYGCFEDIACDRSVLVDYRVDACRYLFATQAEDYKQTSQEALLEVIDTDEYPSDYRYNVIAGFISRTGISTRLNMTKLRIAYDEEFVYGLQTNFFYNEENNVRQRILSGQHMMQMDCVDQEEKSEVGDTLLAFTADSKLDENTRADAADVVFRLGSDDQKKVARQSIVDLGFSAVDKRGVGSLMDRAKTIYNDSQNIHEFGNQIDLFTEKIINETSVNIKPFHEVHQEVSEYLRKDISDKGDRYQAFKALNRISIDTARFTKYKVTLAEMFVHVWVRILGHEKDIQTELIKRMLEELIDMGDTCSSGHSGRFINVLSKYDVSLKISWNDQIKANMAGRMTARIRDCPDSDLRAKLAMADSELASDEDKIAYVKFIQENLKLLKEELSTEFVEGGYITSEEFEKAFEAGTVNWI